MPQFDDLFGFENQETEEQTMYTTKVGIPQYLPSGECPKLYDCYDIKKYTQLVKEINSANITDEEKEFLKFAATRHIKFTYSKVADYYAHASKEMQELMEHSALVIIDFEDAIANGYVQLSRSIEAIRNKDIEK